MYYRRPISYITRPISYLCQKMNETIMRSLDQYHTSVKRWTFYRRNFNWIVLCSVVVQATTHQFSSILITFIICFSFFFMCRYVSIQTDCKYFIDEVSLFVMFCLSSTTTPSETSIQFQFSSYVKKEKQGKWVTTYGGILLVHTALIQWRIQGGLWGLYLKFLWMYCQNTN